ncbi:MAG TPA: pantoate--beta-alanine ligase [Flavobacteriales bacterium]|nr:pantoate--beta-alanine ligase [Flavobacteriales bacterium]HMR26733.1 pantoate--beta-alanine ligase [Flavobacteriales bacterium]
MDRLTIPSEAAAWSAAQRRQGARIGFVPTMGALHAGHLALVVEARQQCDRVVASIFVNPLQFNNPEDLARYPRQPQADARLLQEAGCDLLFLPDAEGLYHEFQPLRYDLGGLDRYWEGPSRPGHFQGVVNVVERLFHYVRPDMAFFGEKDRQQLAIISHVGRTLRWPTMIVPCPTLREADGLAMSSRNQRLGPADRARAPRLHQALQAVARASFQGSVDRARQAGLEVLAADPEIRLDHLGIADPDTLAPLEAWDGLDRAVALIAAEVGPVRLIDNLELRRG